MMIKCSYLLVLLCVVGCGIGIIDNTSLETGIVITTASPIHLTPPDFSSFCSIAPNIMSLQPTNLTPHDPIRIFNDGNFSDYGFPGSGTEEDPYVLENYEILTNPAFQNYGIYISDTTSFFIIRNNHVCGKDGGIYLQRADNCIGIINNFCTNVSNYGLLIEYSHSSSCLITNNVLCYQYSGIYIMQSSFCIVSNNVCNYNDYGIFAISGTYCNVSSNICNFNERTGVVISNDPPTKVFNNTCNSNFRGIGITSSSSCNITKNSCSNNEYEGISIGNSDSCTIKNNSIVATSGYGLDINLVSDNNVVFHNIFIDNELNSQAYDEGKRNKWYNEETKEGNFWSDLENKCTYKIAGSARSKDKFPLNRADSCPNPLVISLLSTLLPLAIAAGVLAFVTPKYIVPFTKNKVIPNIKERRVKNSKVREELIAGRTVSCSNCETLSRKRKLCQKCGHTLPKPKIDKLELIDRWRILFPKQKIRFTITSIFVIGALIFGIFLLVLSFKIMPL